MWMHIVHSLLNVSLSILQNKAVLILPVFCYRAQCVSALSISGSYGFVQHKWRNGSALLPDLALWFAVQCPGFAEQVRSWNSSLGGLRRQLDTELLPMEKCIPEPGTAKNISECSVWNIRQERVKRSTVIILEAGESSAETVLDLSSGHFSFLLQKDRVWAADCGSFTPHRSCRERSAELSNKFWSAVSKMTDSWVFLFVHC